MFRPLVPRRSFSLFNRVPYSRIVQSAARDGHETVTIQRVRIRRRFFSKSRIIFAAVSITAGYAFNKYVDIEVETEEVEQKGEKSKRSGSNEGWQQVGPRDEEDEDEGESLLFLPTGLSRPRERTYYRGEDPEWQEFQRIVKDPERIERIRTELVSLVRTLFAKRMMQNIDVNKGAAWLEFKFPYGPPIEYERPGIELTEDGEWRKVTRPVEAVHHERLNKVLFPTVTAGILYTDFKNKARRLWWRTQMGWRRQKSRWKMSYETYMGREPSPTVKELIQQVDALQRSAPVGSFTSTPAEDATKDAGFFHIDPKNPPLRLDYFSIVTANRLRPSQEVPRGAFMVIGLVELLGPTSRITLDVTAAYDPKEGRFKSIRTKIYNRTRLQQKPFDPTKRL